MRFLLIGLILFAAAGCSSGSRASIASKTFTGTLPIKVVCTAGMVGDLVRNIGGSNVQVTDLFKPGVDPHTYRATTEDLRLLQAADIVFYNGLHLEGKMGDVLEQLGDRL